MITAGVTLLLGLVVAGQQMGSMPEFGHKETRAHREWMMFAPEPVTVPAGKRAVVEVHLRVEEGFHVNSHAPTSELMVPTALTLLEAEPGVTVGAVEYPKGVGYRIPADPGEQLDVYAGAVVLRVPVVASAGQHVLRGTLRYQACDQRACYPVRTISVEQPFTAR